LGQTKKYLTTSSISGLSAICRIWTVVGWDMSLPVRWDDSPDIPISRPRPFIFRFFDNAGSGAVFAERTVPGENEVRKW
jgi:hypothetical protein